MRFLKAPASELIVQATEEKVRAEMKSEEQAKELQVLQEENDRLRNEIKVLQEYKEKALWELYSVRDEKKTYSKTTILSAKSKNGESNISFLNSFSRKDNN